MGNRYRLYAKHKTRRLQPFPACNVANPADFTIFVCGEAVRLPAATIQS
jgi:hypothetical protein